MILDRKEKQPTEIKDYPIDYSEWLSDVGDSIGFASADVTCLTNPADVSLVVLNVVTSPKAVAVWLEGGTDGQRYKVEVTVDTLGGRRDQSEFIVRVREY
jgi:hypothetical protein